MLTKVYDTLYFHKGSTNGNKILALDLDWTLVHSPKGKFFKDASDWSWLPNRILTLNFWRDKGYNIVIFTNQGYRAQKGILALERINNIILGFKEVGLDPWVLVATGKNSYRKPNTGMWEYFIQHVNVNEAIYVGDAAGRITDHSDDDLMFAQNINIPFYTPEEVFPSDKIEITDPRTLIILVGMPGAGKTTFYQTYLYSMIHASKDELKTDAKMKQLVVSALNKGLGVVIDATNGKRETRKIYIDLAQYYQVPCLIIYFLRNGSEYNKMREKPIPQVAYNVYYKYLEEPTLDEGVPIALIG